MSSIAILTDPGRVDNGQTVDEDPPLAVPAGEGSSPRVHVRPVDPPPTPSTSDTPTDTTPHPGPRKPVTGDEPRTNPTEATGALSDRFVDVNAPCREDRRGHDQP